MGRYSVEIDKKRSRLRFRLDGTLSSTFCGSAILVDNSVVALQHRRTSIAGGVMPKELISASIDELEQHLAAALSRRDRSEP